jgi:hypothetical protein
VKRNHEGIPGINAQVTSPTADLEVSKSVEYIYDSTNYGIHISKGRKKDNDPSTRRLSNSMEFRQDTRQQLTPEREHAGSTSTLVYNGQGTKS